MASGSRQPLPHPLDLVQASTLLQAPHSTWMPGPAPLCQPLRASPSVPRTEATQPPLPQSPHTATSLVFQGHSCLSILFTPIPTKASSCPQVWKLPGLGRKQRALRVWSLWVPIQTEPGDHPSQLTPELPRTHRLPMALPGLSVGIACPFPASPTHGNRIAGRLQPWPSPCHHTAPLLPLRHRRLTQSHHFLHHQDVSQPLPAPSGHPPHVCPRPPGCVTLLLTLPGSPDPPEEAPLPAQHPLRPGEGQGLKEAMQGATCRTEPDQHP